MYVEADKLQTYTLATAAPAKPKFDVAKEANALHVHITPYLGATYHGADLYARGGTQILKQKTIQPGVAPVGGFHTISFTGLTPNTQYDVVVYVADYFMTGDTF